MSGLNWDHLAEEVEDFYGYQRIEIVCHLHVLLMHLLRWAVEPDTRED